MDVPRIVPCMPGAELTGTVDEETWRATIAVKLGPMSFLFDADIRRTGADRDAWRATLDVDAREQRGRGSGRATITSTLEPTAEGTHVSILTDLTMAGAVAQYGRGLVQPGVGPARVELRRLPARDHRGHRARPVAPAKPVSGLRLTAAALLSWLRHLGRRSSSTDRPQGGSS